MILNKVPIIPKCSVCNKPPYECTCDYICTKCGHKLKGYERDVGITRSNKKIYCHTVITNTKTEEVSYPCQPLQRITK